MRGGPRAAATAAGRKTIIKLAVAMRQRQWFEGI